MSLTTLDAATVHQLINKYTKRATRSQLLQHTNLGTSGHRNGGDKPHHGRVMPQPCGNNFIQWMSRLYLTTIIPHHSHSRFTKTLTGWRRGVVVSRVRRMNEVNTRGARLVLGWVTVFGLVYHLGM